jgi:hypothetical protein
MRAALISPLIWAAGSRANHHKFAAQFVCFGTKRTSDCRLAMSAFGGKADITRKAVSKEKWSPSPPLRVAKCAQIAEQESESAVVIGTNASATVLVALLLRYFASCEPVKSFFSNGIRRSIEPRSSRLIFRLSPFSDPQGSFFMPPKTSKVWQCPSNQSSFGTWRPYLTSQPPRGCLIWAMRPKRKSERRLGRAFLNILSTRSYASAH